MVIPAYNAEDYIVRCIDTALAQSQPNVEIIFVDDGSRDHTSEMPMRSFGCRKMLTFDGET